MNLITLNIYFLRFKFKIDITHSKKSSIEFYSREKLNFLETLAFEDGIDGTNKLVFAANIECLDILH